jgi:hypothetical protein
MAEAAALPSALTAYTNADWREEPFAFFAGGLGSPEDFTGASARLGLRLAGQAANAAEFTTTNGELTITAPNEIGITAPLSAMSGLEPGQYSFDLIVTRANDEVETVLAGRVRIVGGLA